MLNIPSIASVGFLELPVAISKKKLGMVPPPVACRRAPPTSVA
jgi:hypothetical protein